MTPICSPSILPKLYRVFLQAKSAKASYWQGFLDIIRQEKCSVIHNIYKVIINSLTIHGLFSKDAKNSLLVVTGETGY